MVATTLQNPTQQLGAYAIDDILKGITPVNEIELDVFTNDPVKIALGGLSKVVEETKSVGGDILNLSK